MKIPLLRSKTSLPPILTHYLARQRLVDQLNHGIGSRLILLSAPAGYGKTTLLSAWAAGSGLPVAWLTLDSGDNDLSRFFTYFIAAHTAIDPGRSQEISKTLEMLASSQSLSPEEWVSIVIEQLEEFPGEFIIIMEDYQTITDLLIHQAVDFLLDHKPPQMHVAIATRVDPPLSLAKLRARGELSELRQADLRFTTEEAQVFINRWLGGEMTYEDMALLSHRTEGWVAGLQMACLALRGASFSNHEELTRRVSDFSGSHEYIVDFFAAEVLARQAEQERGFLLKTSILDQLCAGLCNDVTGGTDGQAMLERLQKANLFIIPLDQQRQWYRYHSLFCELLQKQLRQEMPGMVSELHLRASRWYEANGLLEAAFQHACTSGDSSRVNWLVITYSETLWWAGKFDKLLKWIQSLSRDQLEQHPELFIAYAMLISDQGDFKKAEELVDEVRRSALRQMEAAPISEGPSPVEPTHHPEHILGLVHAAIVHVASLKQELEVVVENAWQALQLLEKFNLPADLPWRSETLISMSGAQWHLGNRQAALQTITEAVALGLSCGHAQILISSITVQALMLWREGQLEPAAQACRNGLAYIESHQLEGIRATAGFLATWGIIQAEQGDLESAEACIRQGLALSQKGMNPINQCMATLALSRLWSIKADQRRAESLRQEAEALKAKNKLLPWVMITLIQEGLDQPMLLQKAIAPPVGRQVETTAQPVTPGLYDPLSSRECEVLHLLAEGLSNRQIAGRLYLSLRTVKFHTGNIYQKLGVERRTEAIARARTLGLLS